MRSLILCGLIGWALLGLSCSKNEAGDLNLIWVETDLFLCCNVWGEAESIDDIPAKVKSFFRREGMIAQEVEVLEVGYTVICGTCCKCPADHEIRVQIPSVFKDRAASFGFEER
ncbi:MAG: hypothetical protein HRU41_04695 [Saprospiraceae bacterium]|nr:hypothetical protein [Saprospiraceae bacterium]